MKVQAIDRPTNGRLDAREWVFAVISLCGLVRGRSGNSQGDHGATAVEYALMASLIAIVIVTSVTLFGQNVITLFAVPTSVFNP